MSIIAEHVFYQYASEVTQEGEGLQDVSLQIKEGEFIGIMGQTGCGKTTLLQLLAGLLMPSQGRILLMGEDINGKGYNRDKLRSQVGMVFQYPENQIFETTVEKEVAFGLKHRGLSKTEMRERVQQAVEAVGFTYEAVREQSPLSMSGGEKRRIAIADVLVTRPKILLLDEPIAGLDSRSREQFLRLMKKQQEEGVTVIMISHDADSICEYADRIYVLQDGKIKLEGTPSEVFWNPDRAKELHIGLSEPREIAKLLLERGMGIRQDITRYEDLVQEIIRLQR